MDVRIPCLGWGGSWWAVVSAEAGRFSALASHPMAKGSIAF